MGLYITPNPIYDTRKKAAEALVGHDEGFLNVLSGEHMHVVDPYLDDDLSVVRLRTTCGRTVAVGQVDQIDLLRLGTLDARQLATSQTMSLEEASARVSGEAGWHPMDRRILLAALTAARARRGTPSDTFVGSDGIGYRAVIAPEPVRTGFLGLKPGWRVWVEPLSISGPPPYRLGLSGEADVYESEGLAACGLGCLAALVAEDALAAKGYVRLQTRDER